MYCTACGNKIKEEDLFCPKCGKGVTKESGDYEIEALKVKTDETEKQAEKEMSAPKEIFLMILVLVIIVIISYAVLVYGNVSKVTMVVSDIGNYLKTLF